MVSYTKKKHVKASDLSRPYLGDERRENINRVVPR